MARWSLAAAAPVLLAAWTFLPAAGFDFLNWDDILVVVRNAHLDGPGVWRWALTTRYMEHYQPVGWMVWAAARQAFGPDARVFHLLNLLLHLAVTTLVFELARRLLAAARHARPGGTPVRAAGVGAGENGRVLAGAAVAAAFYAVHPLRVEVVAWVSAMPYALATGLALAATIAWNGRQGRPAWRWLSFGLYAVSLAARPVAVGLPVALVALDWWRRGTPVARAMVIAGPAFVLAAAAAGAELMARAPGLAEVPWAYQLELVTSAPFVYAWRSIVPAGLTPLDALPLDPQGHPLVILLGVAGLAGVSATFYRWRCRFPALIAGWTSYLALLAPAAGLVPSGLQATADRYTYLPGVVFAVAAGGALAVIPEPGVLGRRLVKLAVIVVLAASAAASRRALAHWADSVALWTRVVAVQPASDVGHYNLGAALAERDRPDEAARHYRLALAVNPAYAEARASLDRLEAARLEAEGNRLAAAGHLAAAVERYRQALGKDGGRVHSHAARGMALATLGRGGEAVPHLREALRLGATDPAIPGMLAALLIESGSSETARAVLEDGLRAHPDDIALAHNLARLLAETDGASDADRQRALRLAASVVTATGGRDPRALDTLAAALAANGRVAEARDASARAAGTAEAQGDRELAGQIRARSRAWRDPGP